MAQPMTLQLSTNSNDELEQLLKLLKSLDILDRVSINTGSSLVERRAAVIAPGNPDVDPFAIPPIWQDDERTAKQIREQAWNRD